MIYLIILGVEIVLLFFLSRKLHQKLGQFFFRITKSKKWSTYLLAVLFLPGTFVHEVSHFLASLVLLVPVGQPEFIPEILDDKKVKLGSVKVAKTDPARQTLIGVAPLLTGITLILGGLHFLITRNLLTNPYYLLLTTYFIFTTANTMFMSKSDLEGAWKLLVLVVIIYAAFHLIGLRFSIDPNSLLSNEVIDLVKQASIFLLVPIVIDTILLLFLRYTKT